MPDGPFGSFGSGSKKGRTGMVGKFWWLCQRAISFEADVQLDIEVARANATGRRAPALGNLRFESVNFIGRHGHISAI